MSTPDPAAQHPDEQRFVSAPGRFPTAQVPVWVVMHPEVTPEAVGVGSFILAYRSSTHEDVPHVGRQAIAAWAGRSVDWVDKQTRRLSRAGFLSPVTTYMDALTGRRTYEKYAADGTLNAQTSNDWLINDAPAAGDAHPHPIQSSEFDRPDRVERRIQERARIAQAAQGGAATQRPGSEQAKQGETPGHPPAATQRPGGPPHSGRGGRHTAAQTRTKGTTTRGTTNQPTPAPANDAETGGWLVGGSAEGGGDHSSPEEAHTPASEGRGVALLGDLRAANGETLGAAAVAQYGPVVDEALKTVGERALRDRLAGGVNRAGGIVYRLRQLQTEQRPRAQQAAAGDARPAWCGSCDQATRQVETADGRVQRCRACHPHAGEPTRRDRGGMEGMADVMTTVQAMISGRG